MIRQSVFFREMRTCLLLLASIACALLLFAACGGSPSPGGDDGASPPPAPRDEAGPSVNDGGSGDGVDVGGGSGGNENGGGGNGGGGSVDGGDDPAADPGSETGDACLSADELPPMSPAEILARDFIAQKMTTPEGGIWSNLKDTYPPSPDIGVNHEIISESMALMLMYAYLARDRALFDQTAAFIRDWHLSEYGVLAWKLDPDYSVADASSASIDDLMAARALWLGYRCWGSADDLALARTLQEGALSSHVNQGIFVQAASWGGWGVAADDVLLLSYADTAAMALLAEDDPAWQVVIEATADVLEGGGLGNGLYKYDYDVPSKAYSGAEPLNMIGQVLTAIALADAGRTVPATQTLALLKAEFQAKGSITNEYHLDGTPHGGFEDIAVYAHAARLAMALEDPDFANLLLAKIASLQISDENEETYGAFLWAPNERVFAYPQLCALLAMAQRRNLAP